MWLSVDRVESGTVILVDDGERVYTLPAADYTALAGVPPREGDVLEATVTDGAVTAATPDPAETERRRAAEEARLRRLFERTKRRRRS